MLMIMLADQMHSFCDGLLGGLNASGLLHRFPLAVIIKTLSSIATLVELGGIARKCLERRSLPTQSELGLLEMSVELPRSGPSRLACRTVDAGDGVVHGWR